VRSRWITAAAIGAFACLGPASSASAQSRPYVSSPPTTSGSAVVNSTLTSSGGTAGGPPGTRTGRAWLRCTHPTDERTCEIIESAWDTNTYTLTSADLGKRMRSALYAYRDYRDLVWRMSAATAVVVNPAPPTPPPTPTPVPTPVPTPPPAEQPAPPVSQPLPTVQVLPPVVTAPQSRAKRMRPFPVVRIAGVLTPNGARISRLTVKAPKGARVRISCSGKGCPQRRVVRAAKGKSLRVSPLETYLRAGVKLTFTISRTGYISKVTTIKIRKAKAPLRSDLCREPGAKKRTRCPKG
jgi:hypothetical protein